MLGAIIFFWIELVHGMYEAYTMRASSDNLTKTSRKFGLHNSVHLSQQLEMNVATASCQMLHLS